MRLEAATAWIGAPVARREDRRLLRGEGSFVGDLSCAGMLEAAFVRSSMASGRLLSVGLEPALSVAGVVAVFDAKTLGARGMTAKLEREEFKVTEMPILARDRVRHVGEPIAMAVARDAYAAEDGAEAVVVEYEASGIVGGVSRVFEPGTDRVHEDVPDNVFLDVSPFADPAIDTALGDAALVVDLGLTTSRLSAVPLEGRACLAEWIDRDDQLLLHVSTQVPHQVRTAVAACLGLSEARVRVIAHDVGGGFGLKCVVGREEVAVAAAALQLRRPVRWIEDRWENLAASFHGHEQHYDVRAGFDTTGRLIGLDADILCDVGAYSAFPFTCGVEPLMAAAEMPGPYKVPRYRVRARAIATNKAPTAPYRGVSRPQITLAMERLMDKAAHRLGLDPVEVRLRNLIAADDFPYHGVNGVVYDAGSYAEALVLCKNILVEEGWLALRDQIRLSGDRLVGVGFSCFNERTAYGTEAFAQRRMAVTPGYDTVHIRMEPGGDVVVTTATCAHGQGHETTLAQIVADELGMRPDQVHIRQGDTDLSAYGWGTFGSRSVVIGGGASKRAARELAGKLAQIAADQLEASPDDIVLRDGRASVRGSSNRSVQMDDLANLAYFAAHRLPPGLTPGLEATGSYDPPGTFSNAAHGVVVELEADSGKVRILRYTVVEDCGVMINPTIVEGQVRGGIAQGIAAALYEQHHYDDSGQIQTASLMDYLVPTASEIPEIDIRHLETPSTFSETGAKGVGEGGTIGAPAAVVNAVNDALVPVGAELDELPIRPERILEALERRHASGGLQT